MEEKGINFNYDFHKHYFLKNPKKFFVGKGLCGLVNIGNKCFLNSILQCLSHTLKLTDYFTSGGYKDDINSTQKMKPEHFVLHSYILTLNAMWSNNEIIKPKSFIENISKIHKKYFSLQQQDSHEFLLFLLDILHKTIKYSVNIDINKNYINDEYNKDLKKLMKNAVNTWNNYFENDYSYIVELFYGSKIDIKNCSNCDFKNEVFDPFNNLSLNIIDVENRDIFENLYDILKYNFKEEINIDWNCEKCKNTGCSKKTELWTLPNYLIIHLKRFNHDNSGKLNNLIKFPLVDLNMTEFISPLKEEKYNIKYIYDCYAINYHSGGTKGGHYYSATKNLDNKWYLMNDGNINILNESQLVNSEAYILFYHRKMLLKHSDNPLDDGILQV
jgi:ubiquitin C-terminal hydrolase